MNELNVLTVDTLEVEDISRVLAISKDETVVAMDPSGIKPDLSEYAKKEDVPTKVSELVNDSDYATKEYVDTNEPDLSPYATIVYVDTIVGNINRILETI